MGYPRQWSSSISITAHAFRCFNFVIFVFLCLLFILHMALFLHFYLNCSLKEKKENCILNWPLLAFIKQPSIECVMLMSFPHLREDFSYLTLSKTAPDPISPKPLGPYHSLCLNQLYFSSWMNSDTVIIIFFFYLWLPVGVRYFIF